LHKIELDVQAKWEAMKVFEVDAPEEKCEKFFATFPYPYMNGLLHVGHAFSLTKAMFATNFQRLQGKKVLFPFAYHCTGMPIQAAANKLKREYEVYGSPNPTFPPGKPQPLTKDDVPVLDADNRVTLTWKVPACTGGKAVKAHHLHACVEGGEFKKITYEEISADGKKMTCKAAVEGGACTYKVIVELEDGSMCPEGLEGALVSVDAAPAKKSEGGLTGKRVAKKILMKTGDAAFQFEILRMMGIPPEDIPPFVDPEYWLKFFPPLGTRDLKRFGCPTDFRRSFITTPLNPFYDKFIRWQFRKLKEGERIGFGKRPTMYSGLDGQACMDHDRAEGEGVAPQEYTAIKIELLEKPACMKKLQKKKVYLLAATLRAETMPGQTNCWILPKGCTAVTRPGRTRCMWLHIELQGTWLIKIFSCHGASQSV